MPALVVAGFFVLNHGGKGMSVKPLVIVDMQPCFGTANDERTLSAIETEIFKAKDRRDPVIALEIDCFSPLQDERNPRTHKRLLDHLVGYPLYRMEEKRFDDGSGAVVHALDRLGYDEEDLRVLRVCGVNTDACVLATVLGLSKKLPASRILVLKDACNTYAGRKNYWPLFSPTNVFLVSSPASSVQLPFFDKE